MYVIQFEQFHTRLLVWQHCQTLFIKQWVAMQTFFPLGAILQTVHFEAPPPVVPHKGPLTTVRVTKENIQGTVRHIEVCFMKLAVPVAVLLVPMPCELAYLSCTGKLYGACPMCMQSSV